MGWTNGHTEEWTSAQCWATPSRPVSVVLPQTPRPLCSATSSPDARNRETMRNLIWGDRLANAHETIGSSETLSLDFF